MTNYRQSMKDALEHMHITTERKILERELTDQELKRREEIAKEMNDEDFKDRYGSRWKEVKLAVATKQAKSESVDEKLTTSALKRLAASSNEVLVRVEASKKRLTTVLPLKAGTFFTSR